MSAEGWPSSAPAGHPGLVLWPRFPALVLVPWAPALCSFGPVGAGGGSTAPDQSGRAIGPPLFARGRPAAPRDPLPVRWSVHGLLWPRCFPCAPCRHFGARGERRRPGRGDAQTRTPPPAATGTRTRAGQGRATKTTSRLAPRRGRDVLARPRLRVITSSPPASGRVEPWPPIRPTGRGQAGSACLPSRFAAQPPRGLPASNQGAPSPGAAFAFHPTDPR